MLAGRRGLASAMRKGVGAYLENAKTEGLAVAVTAVVPVCGHNLDELPAIIAHCAAQGFRCGTALCRRSTPAVSGDGRGGGL